MESTMYNYEGMSDNLKQAIDNFASALTNEIINIIKSNNFNKKYYKKDYWVSDNIRTSEPKTMGLFADRYGYSKRGAKKHCLYMSLYLDHYNDKGFKLIQKGDKYYIKHRGYGIVNDISFDIHNVASVVANMITDENNIGVSCNETIELIKKNPKMIAITINVGYDWWSGNRHDHGPKVRLRKTELEKINNI